MSIAQKILEIIASQPNISAADITAKVESKPETVKATLWRLHSKGKILRQKVAVQAKKGPTNQYVYTINQGS
jgi:DeoR/GlpR family transcriptional regulator of sugar metabolism